MIRVTPCRRLTLTICLMLQCKKERKMRSSLRSKFGTSKEAISEGAWIDVVENLDGSMAQLKIKRTNQQNVKFQKQMANHRKAFQGEVFSENRISQALASTIQIIAETVIVDWRNIEEWEETIEPLTEGFPDETRHVPYTKENVLRLMSEFPDLVDLVLARADDIQTFQKETEVKN